MRSSIMIGILGAGLFCMHTITLANGTDMSSGQSSNVGMQTSMDKSMEQGKDAGEAFLEANKSRSGVVVLPDGLQYKVIKKGTGRRKPGIDDKVIVHYAGRLIDGTEFDSSWQRGEPATFPVNAVIPGWTEALQLMKPGSVWEVYIPAPLAYGERGAPPVIGPNQTLIFKVELIDILK